MKHAIEILCGLGLLVIYLEWSTPDDAQTTTGFKVFRMTPYETEWHEVGQTPVPYFAMDSNNLVQGYMFRVVATNEYFESDPSESLVVPTITIITNKPKRGHKVGGMTLRSEQ